jgi:hypothetical protein
MSGYRYGYEAVEDTETREMTATLTLLPEFKEKLLKAWMQENEVAPRIGGGLPYVQFSEQAQLNALLGNFQARFNQTVSAGATAQTSFTIMGTIGSGNADVTPTSGAVYFVGTPGTAAAINQYSNPAVLTATGGTATTMTVASQTVGLARAVGDCVFTVGSTSGPLPAFFMNTIYLGLTTQAVSGATQANVLSGEPTSTGGYARVAVLNNPANWPGATAASPSVKSNGTAMSFPQSTLAWSTGSTNLVQVFIADALTLAGGNVYAIGALGTPQAVNAASITLSFAGSTITLTLT